jgi:hypothetical protein
MADAHKSWREWLRDVYAGWTKDPQRGGCAGDPDYWERDIQRRAQVDREAAGAGEGEDLGATSAAHGNPAAR